jgi:hypothetical protein
MKINIILAVLIALVITGAYCTYSQLSWIDTRVSIIEQYLDLGE